MSKDYLASAKPELKDVKHFGVKGMKWGIRNNRSTSSSSSTATTSKSENETSQERYSRLQAHVKSNGASSLSDDDLRFMGARADAIRKVEQITKKNSNWVADAAKVALKKTLNRELSTIAAGTAAAYISKPILKSVKDSVKTK